MDICVDLAGIEPGTLKVHAVPGRLTVRGVRHAPDPRDGPGQPMQIVSMEIDHGPFSRTVPLPNRIDLGNVRTEYDQGLLWIRFPLQAEG